ncbi:hypothetical protein QQ054_31525 [Oscillatoria amoena NRMC-F 0135]|nr:hypothetical protein [Oscillatoria amoena NRMC-F 0135]
MPRKKKLLHHDSALKERDHSLPDQWQTSDENHRQRGCDQNRVNQEIGKPLGRREIHRQAKDHRLPGHEGRHPDAEPVHGAR